MSDDMSATLAALLADKDAQAPAIGAPGRDWLSFGALRALSADVAAGICAASASGAATGWPSCCPTGPEMAAAFVTIAQAATTAPLNPAYRLEEYRLLP